MKPQPTITEQFSTLVYVYMIPVNQDFSGINKTLKNDNEISCAIVQCVTSRCDAM